MIQEGSIVSGKDMDGNNINNGKLENLVSSFGVAIVRTGKDRTNLTHCYLSDLSEQS